MTKKSGGKPGSTASSKAPGKPRTRLATRGKRKRKDERDVEEPKRDRQSSQHPQASESPSCPNKADILRRKGNELFKQASDGCFGPCVKRSKLERAQEFYNDALKESQSENDQASCFKNLGALRMLWCKMELELLLADHQKPSTSLGDEKQQFFLVQFHLKNSVHFYLQALNHGIRAFKPQEWLDHLHSVLLGMVEWTVEQSSKLSSPPFFLVRSICEGFVDSIGQYPTSQCDAAIVAHKALAECLFNQGIKELGHIDDEKDGRGEDEFVRHTRCLKIMHDCYQPLCVADSLLSILQTGKKLRQEMKDLEEQVQLYQNICQSVQARNEGDRLLTSALLEYEEMNVDLAWDAMDSYKQAALLTRERDVENEAIALSRMGKVYAEVFKDSKKAHGYHFQAIRLALSIIKVSPRIITADWYRYSNKKVDEYQEKIVNEEAKLHHLKRAPVVLKLEDKLQALENIAAKSTESLLEYIYKEHPHPDPRKQLGPLRTPKLVVNTLKKALVHYHPDTNVRHGEEWLVMCEEIAKHLNRKYGSYKFVD